MRHYDLHVWLHVFASVISWAVRPIYIPPDCERGRLCGAEHMCDLEAHGACNSGELGIRSTL